MSDPTDPIDVTVLGTMTSSTVDAHAEVDAPLPGGTNVGRYVILRAHGHGAMGIVYVAYDPELDRKIALKLVRPSQADDDGRARVLREAQAMARLSHPNVVAIHDVGTFEERVFIAMEFVEGRTLTSIIGERLPWRRVLDLFVKAGRGLAAAHRAGLVHRDFKPDNVLLRSDGRVLVTDFGLARPAGSVEPPPPEIDPSTSFSHSMSMQLTQTGRILGTPAYMSPEQHLGKPTDARTDQFAFCVALYEGLYGVRPFDAATLTTLVVQVVEGRIREPPSDVRVPVWLRRAVTRGLAVDPAARWDSMDALLAELEGRPVTLRRRQQAALFAIAGAVLVGAVLQRPAEQMCTAAEERIAAVWSKSDHDRVRTALLASEMPYAENAWNQVERALDAHAVAWSQAYRDACLAHARGEQSDDLLDRRMACLDENLGAVRARIDVLAGADAGVVEHAAMIASDLPPLEGCADIKRLLEATGPPEDPRAAAEWAKLRDVLAKAAALEAAGKYASALELARTLLEPARELGHEPFLAQVLLRIGTLETDAGEQDSGFQHLREAFWKALASRADVTAIDAALTHSFALSDLAAEYDEALAWSRHASALAERGETQVGHQSRIETSIANVYLRRGDYQAAREHYERLLELTKQEFGDEHPQIAAALNNLGTVHEALGEYDSAHELHGRSLAMKRRLLGDDHPDVASSLHNLGNIAFRRGKMDEAEGYYRQALRIVEAAHGARHVRVAELLTNLGTVAERKHDWKAAQLHQERALSIFEETLGADHPNIGVATTNLGSVLGRMGQHERALQLHERSLRIFEATFGPDHPHLGFPLTGIGKARLGRGEIRLALDALDRALVVREKAEADPTEVADTRYARARALWANGDRGGEAVSEAETARTLFQRAGSQYANDVSEIDDWLTRHR